MPLPPVVRLREARETLKGTLRGYHFHYQKSGRIVREEIAKARYAVIATIAQKTGLTINQVGRRVYVSRGKYWRIPSKKWKFAQVKTRHKANIIHAGRLNPKRTSRAKGSGITVGGKTFKTGFFWNPEGRRLIRNNKRVYQRTVYGIRAIRERDVGLPTIPYIYRTSGLRIELGLIRRTVRRLLNEAIQT